MENFKEPEIKSKTAYSPFDPESELEKLKHAPTKEKKQKISEYKENLINQRKGIASIIKEIDKTIHQNPSISFDNLSHVVSEKAPQYRLTEEQLNNFSEALKKYTERHEIVEKYKNLHPEAKNLFKECLGVEPEGQIEVIYNPITIHFICHNHIDYAKAYTQNMRLPKSGTFFGDDEIKSIISAFSAGAAISQVKNDELKNIITISDFHDRPEENRRIINHEEQHQSNTLFKPKKKDLVFSGEISRDNSENKINNLLLELTRGLREMYGIDQVIRDEVLSHYKSASSPEEIYNLILTYYNYPEKIEFRSAMEAMPEILQKIFKNEVSVDGNPVILNIEEVKSKVGEYFETKYKDDLKSWIDSIPVLEKKRFSRDEILSLLYSYPIDEWPGVARKMP